MEFVFTFDYYILLTVEHAVTALTELSCSATASYHAVNKDRKKLSLLRAQKKEN